MTLTQKRETGLDLLKAIAILLVVLGHSIQYTSADFDANRVFRFIYSFHMPLFMFLSGVLSLNSLKAENYIAKRFSMLVIPFVAWLSVYAVINHFREALSGNIAPLLLSLKDAIIHPDNGGLWFLWVLFLINAIMHVFPKTNRKYPLALLLIAALYLPAVFGLHLVLGLELVRWHLFFFAMGMYFRESGIIRKMNFSFLALLIPLLVLLEYSWSRTGSYPFGLVLGHGKQKVFDLAMNYLVAITAVTVFFKLSTLYTRSNAVFDWLSRNSLAVYATHFALLPACIAFSTNYLALPGTLVAGTFLLTLATSVLVILVLKKNRVCDRILFGNRT